MSKSVYYIQVSDTAGNHTTMAYGNLKMISTHARAAVKELSEASGEFSAEVSEVKAVGSSEVVRSVVNITSEADAVAYVLKKKMATEAKMAAEETDNDPESTGVDVEESDPFA